MELPQTLLERAEALQCIVISVATSDQCDHDRALYKPLRTEFLQNPHLKPYVPSFIVNCRDLDQFWSFIKVKFAHYYERRQFIWAEFAPLLNKIDSPQIAPLNKSIQQALATPSIDDVHDIWARAQERCASDPEGAITLARTLLETVCRRILESEGVIADESWDLPRLYREVSQKLNLSPTQHTEQIFKQILGSCQQVVENLGALRNKLGDAHGKAQKIKPATRHAELAVNLSGSMSLFLVQTWDSRKKPSTVNSH